MAAAETIEIEQHGGLALTFTLFELQLALW
jgi:hypothetical protein